MFEGTFEEFQHIILRLKDEDVRELYKHVDFLKPIELIEMLIAEISRRKLDVGYGLTVTINNRGFERIKSKL